MKTTTVAKPQLEATISRIKSIPQLNEYFWVMKDGIDLYSLLASQMAGEEYHIFEQGRKEDRIWGDTRKLVKAFVYYELGYMSYPQLLEQAPGRFQGDVPMYLRAFHKRYPAWKIQELVD